MGSRSGTMELDLNALRVFVFVVEAHGVTEAARRLGLPKSTVSRQVRDLEARLGETLLERHGRGLAATAAGRRLHEIARGAVGALSCRRERGITTTRGAFSTFSVVVQVNSGVSCTMPTAIISARDQPTKRRQVMLTSQFA